MTQFITSNLENHNQIQQTGFTANLNALFPRPPLMPKHREWHIERKKYVRMQLIIHSIAIIENMQLIIHLVRPYVSASLVSRVALI
jgi:hypothetical protein